MSSRSNTLSPGHLAGASAETVREIVQRAENKLSALQASRTHLRKRIQALNHLSRALPGNVVASNSVESAAKKVPAPGPRAPETGREFRNRPHPSSALRRACRIALMETDAPESAAQILERIAKRNSISIENLADPESAVIAELKQMASEGETTCLAGVGTERWQRMYSPVR